MWVSNGYGNNFQYSKTRAIGIVGWMMDFSQGGFLQSVGRVKKIKHSLNYFGDIGQNIIMNVFKCIGRSTIPGINWQNGYLSINCVRTNGPTLCPIVWLPYAPEYVDKTS